jgi:hypothetical protein
LSSGQAQGSAPTTCIKKGKLVTGGVRTGREEFFRFHFFFQVYAGQLCSISNISWHHAARTQTIRRYAPAQRGGHVASLL